MFTPSKPVLMKCMCSGTIDGLPSLCHPAGAFYRPKESAFVLGRTRKRAFIVNKYIDCENIKVYI